MKDTQVVINDLVFDPTENCVSIKMTTSDDMANQTDLELEKL